MSFNFYNENAKELAQQYLSKSFDEVHESWSQFLPSIIENPNARILDLGAGSGRDSKHLAELAAKTHNTENNIQIFAAEPLQELSIIGQKSTQSLNVKWLKDSLPALSNVTKQEVSFDLILLSAVWMHIPPSDRARSIRKLANLLKPGGKLVISLRHGQTGEECKKRKVHHVCVDELKQLATDVGLFTKLETPKEEDKLGRHHVSWQTVVLQMPDDGTGAFPFIRHVAINDGKSATHKLALLIVLLRIADYRIGNLFTGDDAKALYRTISHAVNNISDMPAQKITYVDSKKTVFEVNKKTVRAKDSIFLDLQTLEQWGEFSLPESTWLAFNSYACWIEPVLVSEWVKTMASYSGNVEYASPENQYRLYQALEPKRTTTEVRQRFEQLKKRLPQQEQM